MEELEFWRLIATYSKRIVYCHSQQLGMPGRVAVVAAVVGCDGLSSSVCHQTEETDLEPNHFSKDLSI